MLQNRLQTFVAHFTRARSAIRQIKAIFLSSPYYLKLINVIFRVREQVNSPFLYFVNLLLFNILGFFVGYLFVCLEEKQFPTLQW